MYNTKVIKNYANALYAYADEKKATELILAQLEFINQAINNNESLKSILQSPIINKSIKTSILTKIVNEFGQEKLLEDFLLIVIKNSRELILSEIYQQYKQLLDKDKNIENVHVTSARVLDQSGEQVIIDYLQIRLTDKNIAVKFNVDATIMGGILISYSNNVIDLSILGKINTINKISQ
ncbi:MAG: ATP synthase F1 subunit delta [Rickettsiaceae bacterium]|nr:MAG: ATP synthase F1 subunit delta [Rickettsiaceae bacterium]